MDNLTPEQRSYCMSCVRSKNTKPEVVVRKILTHLGYRYRLHCKDVPGRPDIVFKGGRKVIFVHGCFWHRHDCKKGRSVPSTNVEFWLNKFNVNVSRDRLQLLELEREGWEVLVIWECELREESLDLLTSKLMSFLS